MNALDRSRCETKKLQAIIANEFPANPYNGAVTAVTNDSLAHQTDTDGLNTLLAGKSWKDLDLDFIDTNHDEYVLMNDVAVVAFLGAWLSRAADNLHADNHVRNSLIFHLASFGGSASGGYGLWANGFRSLSQRQRKVIYLLLDCAADASQPEDIPEIRKALKSLEVNTAPE